MRGGGGRIRPPPRIAGILPRIGPSQCLTYMGVLLVNARFFYIGFIIYYLLYTNKRPDIFFV